jgi:hypothetical protein
MNFSVEASVALEGKFDKWEAPISDVAIAC